MARKAVIKPHPKPSYPKTFVRQWRKFRGLTVETLAERIGMSHASLSRIERGIQNYDAEFLGRTADALSCTVPDLMIRDPTDPDGIWSVWDHAKPGERAQIIELSRVVLRRTGTSG